jgi:tetratricopeptide (TPR) repeat protein
VERAAARLAGFSLTPANAPAVAQICRQLDGIPLALELAAARVNVLPVEQIAARLSDRFQLLTGGSRTALPRHQTLQALIDWSYDLLSDPERRLLQRLAVFVGGWTLEAAEAICGDEAGTRASNAPAAIGETLVLDLLGGLVNKSLVVTDRLPDQSMRYNFLETIRQYALRKLDASGEAGWVRPRHANYYVALAEAGANVEPSPPSWLGAMQIERDNLRAALAWSQSSPTGADVGLRLAKAMDVGIAFTNWSEARGWLESALARAEAEGIDNPPIRARILYSLGWGLGFQGDLAAAEARLLQALELFRELGPPRLVAVVMERLGWIARERGDIATARLRLEESVKLWRSLGEPLERSSLPIALNTLGELTIMQGNLAPAEALLDEALGLFRQIGDRFGEAWSLNHLGHVEQLRNEFERAGRLHAESLALFEALNVDIYSIAEANHANGETALARGDIALAAKHFARSLELARQSGFRAIIAWALAGLAGVALLEENPERAARLWAAAEALRQSIGVRQAPASSATHQRLMTMTREQLGEAIFAAEWAAGEAMTLEQALAEATAEN